MPWLLTMLFLWVVMFFLVIGTVFADIYVVYKADNNEVYSLSEADDAMAPEGYGKAMVEGSIDGLQHSPRNYIFKNDKLSPNFKKIEADEKIINDAKEKSGEIGQVEKRALKTAYESLKAEGVKFKHLKDSDF